MAKANTREPGMVKTANGLASIASNVGYSISQWLDTTKVVVGQTIAANK